MMIRKVMRSCEDRSVAGAGAIRGLMNALNVADLGRRSRVEDGLGLWTNSELRRALVRMVEYPREERLIRDAWKP